MAAPPGLAIQEPQVGAATLPTSQVSRTGLGRVTGSVESAVTIREMRGDKSGPRPVWEQQRTELRTELG